MSNVITTTDTTFDDIVLKSDIPVLVDFWAQWCGPCKMIAPMLDELAISHAGKLKVCKVNIDENPQSPTKFGVRGIPTMLIFKGSVLQAIKVGALPKQALLEWVDSQL